MRAIQFGYLKLIRELWETIDDHYHDLDNRYDGQLRSLLYDPNALSVAAKYGQRNVLEFLCDDKNYHFFQHGVKPVVRTKFSYLVMKSALECLKDNVSFKQKLHRENAIIRKQLGLFGFMKCLDFEPIVKAINAKQLPTAAYLLS